VAQNPLKILGLCSIVSLIGSTLYGTTLPNAYEKSCTIFQEETAMAPIGPESAARIQKRMQEELQFLMIAKLYDYSTTKSLVDAFGAISAADPSVKYSLLVRSAKDAGLPNWSCPAIESAFMPHR
jgi:hypothetical protein